MVTDGPALSFGCAGIMEKRVKKFYAICELKSGRSIGAHGLVPPQFNDFKRTWILGHYTVNNPGKQKKQKTVQKDHIPGETTPAAQPETVNKPDGFDNIVKINFVKRLGIGGTFELPGKGNHFFEIFFIGH
ncbi:MAG: hypothetical protein HWN68_14960 [Desulfobacterales bacterium]|nr:hypothetical protein [Desulfobacterales bacterium]